jgi:hypothetical protein
MQLRNYSEAKERFGALVGIQDISSQEYAWFRQAFNRRAQMAYASTTYWPRFLVVDEPRPLGPFAAFNDNAPSKGTIDVLMRVARDPKFRARDTLEWQWVLSGDEFRVLNHPMSNTGSLDTAASVTELDTVVLPQQERVRAVSFWYKGSIGAEDGNMRLFAANTTPPQPTVGVGDGGVVLVKNGTAVTLTNEWVNNDGISMTWYVDAVNIGVDFGSGDAGVDITTYLDDAWHFYYGVLSDQNNVQYMKTLVVGGADGGAATGELADIRFYQNDIGIDSIRALNLNGNTVLGSEVYAWPFGLMYATYIRGLTATYGDGSGDNPFVPREWFEYCVHGAYADWLRAEGQTAKALAEDQWANGLLMQELDKAERSGSDVVVRLSTHSNRQGRN